MAEHTTIEVAGHEVKVSNPQKIFFPAAVVWTALCMTLWYTVGRDLGTTRSPAACHLRVLGGPGHLEPNSVTDGGR